MIRDDLNFYETQKEVEIMRNRNYEEGTWDARGCSAFMAGALIGAGAALLLAPQPGTELRGMLRD